MPRHILYTPDLWLCPSLLDLQWAESRGGGKFLPVPVDVPHRPRSVATTFIMNSGHVGLKDRNGTGELIDALRICKTRPRFILRSQKPLQWEVPSWVEVRVGTIPYADLWTEGDVFVFPEKFNGLSLPLQEAYAAGMLVLATDRFPMNTWLPKEPLIPSRGSHRECVSGAYCDFDCAEVDPVDIAAAIDRWAAADVSVYSEMGRVWAEQNSWRKLGPLYKEILCNLLYRPA